MKKVLTTLLLLTGVFMFIACSSGPGNSAKSYILAMRDGKYEKFVDGIASNKKFTAEDKAQMTAMLKEKTEKSYEKKGGIKRVKILHEEIAEDGQTATVTIKTTFGNGEEEESKQKMILQDGKWKMNLGK